MKIVFIPQWMKQALEQAGRPASVALNISSLMGILSKEDVAFYLFINTCLLPDLLPAPFVSTFPPQPYLYGTAFGNAKRDNSDDTFQIDVKEVERLVLDMVTSRRKTGFVKLDWATLTCDLLDEDTLVFYPVKDDIDGIGGNSTQAKLALYDRVIQQVYGFMAFNDLMLTPMLEDYLRSTQATYTRETRAFQVPATNQ